MKYNIPFSRVLKQLKDDLIGKDAHRGITLTYAWLANQFGHFSLGFIPAFLLHHFTNLNGFWAAFYVVVFWAVFEAYNFLGPLLSKRNSRNNTIFIPKKNTYTFAPKWHNLAFDTFTDICFFALGAFVFGLLVDRVNSTTITYIIIILCAFLFFAIRYWYITKMYQFYARFPFQFRLSQWDFPIHKTHKDIVDDFLNLNVSSGKHLLISGNISTGKTSLGIGILNELSIKHNSCLYVNAIKMYNHFFNEEEELLESHEIWNWKTTNFLMIDDINPSEPIHDELISPEKLMSFIDTFTAINTKNRALLKGKNVIWVLGNSQENMLSDKNKWKNMLIAIGIDNQNISSVSL
ncbi:ATP-binding protein [Polaribacter tangerinus]|uniref:ATP-binding protein n=1 Tax=Polaribacter tangerinus TaxID=1920034 RepID=UPI000B4A7C32|nr:ATP-binding protein [Polaribacter tangerinus]